MSGFFKFEFLSSDIIDGVCESPQAQLQIIRTHNIKKKGPARLPGAGKPRHSEMKELMSA